MRGAQPTLVLFLLLACLRGILPQQPAVTGEARKPFFERFRRLEEQFRRFQEVTLLRLQEIAGNYNVSYNVDARFEHLLSKHEGLEAAANETHGAVRGELRRLEARSKKLQRSSKQQGRKVAALEGSLQAAAEDRQRHKSLLANLTEEVAAERQEGRAVQASVGRLWRAVEGLQDALKAQGSKLDDLEQQLRRPAEDNEVLPPPAHLLGQPAAQAKLEPEAVVAGGLRPALKKLQAKHQQGKKLQEESLRLTALSQRRGMQAGPLGDQTSHLGGTPSPQASPSPPEPQALSQPATGDAASQEPEVVVEGPRKPAGQICNVESMLVFPNSSTENYVALEPGLNAALLELSLCAWVRTGANYLGTILSYATEENDNKLVLHGRDAAPRSGLHFVIGDPAFRELPVERVLDGRWHHLCVVWSSIQGRYWFYVDRRVASLGSRFRKGYEIPPGGSLILGQEQDVPGGGFEPSESFVGSLAGLAMWDRALSPGEVSAMATGKGLPRGPILTLSNASALHGAVRKVNCACLEHCL